MTTFSFPAPHSGSSNPFVRALLVVLWALVLLAALVLALLFTLSLPFYTTSYPYISLVLLGVCAGALHLLYRHLWSHTRGWYSDPAGRFKYRFWTGRFWTDQVSNGGGVADVDPQGLALPEGSLPVRTFVGRLRFAFHNDMGGFFGLATIAVLFVSVVSKVVVGLATAPYGGLFGIYWNFLEEHLVAGLLSAALLLELIYVKQRVFPLKVDVAAVEAYRAGSLPVGMSSSQRTMMTAFLAAVAAIFGPLLLFVLGLAYL